MNERLVDRLRRRWDDWRHRSYDKGHSDGSRVAAAAYAEGYHDALRELRAKVEALPTVNVDGYLYVGMVWWQDVRDLFDGVTDD